MRLPLPPATLRAGGRISAGMISSVQTPLPICAAIAPNVCPHRCAPSPESLMISTICSLKRTAGFLAVLRTRAGSSRAGGDFPCGVGRWLSVILHSLRRRECARNCARGDRCRRTLPAPFDVGIVDAGIAYAQIGLHAARGLAAGAHGLDHGRRAGDDVTAGKNARHRRRQSVVGLDIAALVETEMRGLADDRVGIGADREHDLIGLELELAARHRDRTPPARIVRARRAPCGCSAWRARCPCHHREFPPGRSANGIRCPLPRRGELLPRAPGTPCANADRCSRPSRRPAAGKRASHPWPCCRRRSRRRACRAEAACRNSGIPSRASGCSGSAVRWRRARH